jgi:hypothetical protein
MLPAPPPDKMPSRAEPGKPLYTRRPTQRQRPGADKREMEGERKLHPTRQRPGAGDRRSVMPIAPPEPPPRATFRSPKALPFANSPKNSTFAPKNF